MLYCTTAYPKNYGIFLHLLKKPKDLYPSSKYMKTYETDR